MTLDQLEKKVNDLERQLAELRREVQPLCRLTNVSETFGMFGDDPEFDQIVQLGREYRDQANSEDD